MSSRRTNVNYSLFESFKSYVDTTCCSTYLPTPVAEVRLGMSLSFIFPLSPSFTLPLPRGLHFRNGIQSDRDSIVTNVLLRGWCGFSLRRDANSVARMLNPDGGDE